MLRSTGTVGCLQFPHVCEQCITTWSAAGSSVPRVPVTSHWTVVVSGSRCQEGRDPLVRSPPSVLPLTRAVQNVSSHFEYLENRSRGLDVTWQPVRGDLTVHP